MAEFKDSLNLPNTKMPQRAGLKNIEPELAKKFPDLFDKLMKKNSDAPTFVLHDGPPYPNGDIHLGHALNKTLKDIVIKYKAMKGFKTPFTPGWDCHGLPIETQLLKELKKKKEVITDKVEFRERCKEYALGYVANQKEQFKRLGIFADWENPYLTLQPKYEKEVISLIGDLIEKELIFKSSKPIHWCHSCKTALAEAEIEYDDHKSPSIYIKFEIARDQKTSPENYLEIKDESIKQAFTEAKKTSFIVWTTTPWTLPANVAVAVNPNFIYSVVEDTSTGEYFILAEELREKVLEKLNISFKELGKLKGSDLEGVITNHPFADRHAPIVTANYVTAEDGTGCVHIAPGHGQDDHIVGLQFNLPVIMPVDENGTLTEEAGIFAGLNVAKDANQKIIEHLEEIGKLLKVENISHSYPHCWRCKSPVIFRATPQWFISVDNKNNNGKSIRELGLEGIKQTKWFPSWGENRLRSMVEGRPDWCISRQRSWGIPIPVFYCKKCGEPQLKKEFIDNVAQIIGKEGTNAWFQKEPSELLPTGAKCKCGSNEFEKETDILDVWVESGASQRSVLRTNPNLTYPADLYLEGSDQHRGWFQSSLLLSVGETGKAPYKQVLTHGFTIDDKGRKMSKSMGNVISVKKTIDQYGADILRLWVASTDFKNDMAVADSILKQVQDDYLKIRNTWRFLISNLYDYEKGAELLPADRWLLSQLQILVKECDEDYNEYEFHKIFHRVHDFCVNELSSLHMDFNKDNLYCNAAKSKERRSTQEAFFIVLETLLRIMAPIMTFTTEDTWQYFSDIAENSNIFLPESPLLAGYPEADSNLLDEKLNEDFSKILEIRELANQKMEELRKDKTIAASLEATVTIYSKNEFDEALLERLFIVSKVIVIKSDEFKVEVTKTDGEKCERCWKYEENLTNNLCSRCADVVNSLKE